jgi:hypothetical protein
MDSQKRFALFDVFFFFPLSIELKISPLYVCVCAFVCESQKSVKRWDVRKKKYVQVQLQGNESILEKKNKLKNESGSFVKESKKGKTKSIYEEWKKKKRRIVQTAGDEGYGDDGDSDKEVSVC